MLVIQVVVVLSISGISISGITSIISSLFVFIKQKVISDEICSAIEETRSDVCDVYNLNIEYDMDDVKYKIDSIKSTVIDIQESIGDGGRYNSSSFYDIDDVMSAVNDTKELAESARDAAESAKDAAESAKDTVESHFY